jgi:NAD dependent epimerase/dehydratase family enzyme
MGLGARLGDGSQYMSWVALDDVVGAVLHALESDALAGPVNVTSPNPVTNREFTETVGRVLSRPTLLSVPRFLLRLAPGDMADEAILASARVVPSRLLDTGYVFRLAELEPALKHALEPHSLHAGA